MSNYFSYFPTTPHDISNIGQTVTLTNIMRRFKLKSKLKGMTEVYHSYDIQAGDRPDTIANKYYGSSSYDWVVLLFNDIVDPVFGWPLFNQDFDNHLKAKYQVLGNLNLEAAQTEIHEYRKILIEGKVLYDGTIIKERYVVVDKETYDLTTPLKRKTIYKIDYEIEKNDEKRKIKLLDKQYLPKLRAEVELILRDGV
jgi:hypothetical protein